MRDSSYTYFTTVLYPDNPLHCTFISCIDSSINYTGLKICYILHDKCRYVASDTRRVYDSDLEEMIEEPVPEFLIGKLKKSHWHLYIKSGYQMTERSFRQCFAPLVQLPEMRIEAVKNPPTFCAYLTHTDPRSIMLGKTKYSVDDFRGDTQILHVDESISMIDFYNFVFKWRCEVMDYDCTFASLTLALHLAGFGSFIKKNSFICTRIMSEAVQMKKDVAYCLRNGFSNSIY